MNKIERLRKALLAAAIDALLVLDEFNCKYLSGFTYHDGAFLVTEKSAHLLTDFRYIEAASKAVESEIKITQTRERTSYIKDILLSEKVKKLGFVGSSVTYSEFKKICCDFPDIELVDVTDILTDLRAVKYAEEIECIAKAQSIADEAFSELLKIISPNMTEIEVAAEIDYLMRRKGSEGPAFSTVAVSGDASSLPHGVPRNEKLKAGFLTMDFGAKYNGYCSDMTRTVSIGKADRDMKKLYETVLEAQRSALEFLKAGIIASKADEIARNIIDSVPEFKGAFGHSLGHSVGLEVHESPSLSPRSENTVLSAGNIVTVEPGIYLEGKYGCRIEDMVLITECGIHNFTQSDKDLIEIY